MCLSSLLKISESSSPAVSYRIAFCATNEYWWMQFDGESAVWTNDSVTTPASHPAGAQPPDRLLLLWRQIQTTITTTANHSICQLPPLFLPLPAHAHSASDAHSPPWRRSSSNGLTSSRRPSPSGAHLAISILHATILTAALQAQQQAQGSQCRSP